jgi:hypothetical protein
MKIPHKHSELIKAWANGAKIQLLGLDQVWVDMEDPSWRSGNTYRIKPEEPKDYKNYCSFLPAKEEGFGKAYLTATHTLQDTHEVTFSGTTHKVLSVRKIGLPVPERMAAVLHLMRIDESLPDYWKVAIEEVLEC